MFRCPLGAGPQISDGEETAPSVRERVMEQVSDAALPGEAGQARSNGPASTVFSIRMICGGEEQSTDLPIDQTMIGQLALEAEIRDMRIGELLAALIIANSEDKFAGATASAAPKTGSERWQVLGAETTQCGRE